MTLNVHSKLIQVKSHADLSGVNGYATHTTIPHPRRSFVHVSMAWTFINHGGLLVNVRLIKHCT